MHWIDLARKGIPCWDIGNMARDHAVPVIAGISVTLSIIIWQKGDEVPKIQVQSTSAGILN